VFEARTTRKSADDDGSGWRELASNVNTPSAAAAIHKNAHTQRRHRGSHANQPRLGGTAYHRAHAPRQRHVHRNRRIMGMDTTRAIEGCILRKKTVIVQ
jgi:hypothetical protein